MKRQRKKTPNRLILKVEADVLVRGLDDLLPNGDHLLPNGDHLLPNGDQLLPNGRHLLPNGRHLLPNGRHLLPSLPLYINWRGSAVNQLLHSFFSAGAGVFRLCRLFGGVLTTTSST